MIKNYSAFFLFFVLLFSCQNENENELIPSDPEVITNDASFHSSGGVNLSGNYEPYATEISKVGVEYSTDEFFTNSETVFTEVNTDHKVSCYVPNGLNEGDTYFFRVFVQSSEVFFYGDTKSFIANKNAAPVIESLSSELGYREDTLTITGQYLKDRTGLTYVYFNEVRARVINTEDSIIECVVPSALESVTNNVVIKIGNRESNALLFSLYKPELTSISPLNCVIGETLTITGNHFDDEVISNKVYFGNVMGEITYADRKTIKVVVPLDIATSSDSIKVNSQLQEVTFDKKYQIKAPTILSVPQNVYANQSITIKGEHFHPDYRKNKITIEEVETVVSNGDVSSINTRIPLGPFPRKKAKVRVQVLDMVTEYNLDLNIQDKWVMVSDSLPFSYYRSINNAAVINDEAYVIARSRDISSEEFFLWKFNPSDYTWEKSKIPFSLKWSGVLTSNGNKLYCYSAKKENRFWEYDPSTSLWTELATYPGGRRDYATHFSINGDIYIGMGADFEPYSTVKYGDFYKYSPTEKTWTRIEDFRYQNYFTRTETTAFTINGIAYVGNGASNTGMVDFWKYDPILDLWLRVADFNDARKYTSAFVMNGYGYVTGGSKVGGSYTRDCWRYDPSSDRWTKENSIGPLERGGHFSFSINGKAYIGGGVITNSGGKSGNDLFEYIP
ncbi:IPT/TIG domain-containing protein [Flammeovirga sp. OC4]|uniref:IPT/TIG domain-containing protein n=1 Tax=Flammeovirga sp. OC4 TaxID=1382345 RepID=UPI0005C6308D|nr:IPT/TIG domain-containing protein [Flammeovirga sp. OC4]